MFVERTRGSDSMDKEQFFKPTPLYKEFMILDLISKNSDVTQRVMAEGLDVSVSMVNLYLEDYEKRKLIKREYRSPKDVRYEITKKGLERKKVLNIGFLKSAQTIYYPARDNILAFLDQIVQKGFKKILLYGAGEVAEIFLQVIYGGEEIPLSVVAIIDDDPKKQGSKIMHVPVISREQVSSNQYDGILISSYSNQAVIFEKLKQLISDESKILNYFFI